MKQIQEFLSNIRNTFPSITVVDILDILLVAFVIYQVINLIRSTSAYRIAKAIVILLIVTAVTDLLNFHTINYLLERVLELGFVALVIVFQPELRRFLEKMGGRSMRDLIGINSSGQENSMPEVIRETVEACEAMSKERVGALIVFERENSLEQVSSTGTKVDAAVSQELIRNIFFRETADCVVVIVSEETGTISVAINGMLKRYLSNETLRRLLTQELIGDEKKSSVIDKLKGHRKGGGKDARS